MDDDDLTASLGSHHWELSETLVNAIHDKFLTDNSLNLKTLREAVSEHPEYTRQQREMILKEINEKENTVSEYIDWAKKHPDEMKRVRSQ